MFCDQCGTQLQMGQGFCTKCGKQITGGIQISHPSPNRVREHIRLIGILWLAISAFEAIEGVAALVVANTIFWRFSHGPQAEARAFLQPLVSFIGVLILLKAAAGFAAGWGLLQREPWARMLSIVLAFFALFHVPFGTALGIYTLWVLLPSEADKEYEEQSRAKLVA
ncbi:MAG TPA: zinc ribbon domain-containing protein [Terriglobales bacterium]|nr:zinc ribbon domain-containing protein [Terriglobales bacterium]